MSNARNTNHTSVIHIRAGKRGESEGMDTLLASMPCRVITWTDVYSGLAKLGRLAQDPARKATVGAVVVDLDSLAATEMPFFTFASRRLPQTPILAYGARAGTARVKEACELGAAGEADKETIEAVLEPCEAAGDSMDHGLDDTAVTTHSPLDQRLDPPPSTPIAPAPTEAPSSTPEADRRAEKNMGEEDESGPTDAGVVPVRVPWLRYGDVPTRRGPSRAAPAMPKSTCSEIRDPSPGSTQDSRDDSGPLLTDEELRALIGDDISAIAPPEPSRRPPSDGSDNGGDA